ncbi:MAG TPA: zinc-binding dehydrogenase [Bacteroidota bacterium]|nr:zinc-binding dehydrogenase [Bacteroidota bacterium]
MRRRVYRVSRAGSLRRLQLKEEEAGPPGAQEVAVNVKAIGLNFADVFTILGLYRAAPKRDCIPGIEFSGEVAELGSNVTGLKTGDRVMGSIRFGGFTDRLTIDHRYVLPIPETWSYAEGAAFIVQALTAYYALLPLGNLQPGQTVLIHSAVGGVGLNANRIAKRFSAYTIGTVGSQEKVALAQQEGYDAVIVRSRDFSRDVRQALGDRELNLVLDAVGGKTQRESFRMLATTGRLVAYGLSEFASHMETPNYLRLAYRYLRLPRYHTLSLIESNKSVLGFNLIWLYDRVDVWRAMLQEIQQLGLPAPRIGATFPFERLVDAVRTLQSGKTTGKVVVTA